ncbi:hypothetical protein M8C21_033908 [Ambrosia artemisiifolia]|uniref:Uncharacterized protein n=1 Tax=Ambrosia artemisiifolia TaxID=4212 RepID=A0AAD5DGB7_AMBAR|nr:hypothetical protein M8C21_033908 [Ambrosia artemisiifolia]
MGCNGSVSATTHGVDEAVVDIGVPVVRLGFTATDASVEVEVCSMETAAIRKAIEEGSMYPPMVINIL